MTAKNLTVSPYEAKYTNVDRVQQNGGIHYPDKRAVALAIKHFLNDTLFGDRAGTINQRIHQTICDISQSFDDYAEKETNTDFAIENRNTPEEKRTEVKGFNIAANMRRDAFELFINNFGDNDFLNLLKQSHPEFINSAIELIADAQVMLDTQDKDVDRHKPIQSRVAKL